MNSQHMKPFNFDFNVEVFSKASAAAGKDRRIGGIVSTDHLDRQQETLLQDGLDFNHFLTKGWFNDNHSKDTDGVVGYPEFCELRNLPDGGQGWYVEGYLLKTERADRLWELANELQKTDRRLGFSVEGSIIERDPDNPKTVRKAAVREVAITKCPVNTETSLSVLAKSLSAGHAGSGGNSGVPGAMAPITQESLEAQVNPRPRAKKKKKMRKAEAVAYLMKAQPKLHEKFATRIVEYALRHHAA